MSFLSLLHRFIPGSKAQQTIKPAAHFKQIGNLIEPAFEVAGITYYQFKDFKSVPITRALKTASFYAEYQMKCTMPFLQLHCEAVRAVLHTEGVIDVFKLNELNDQLLERLSMTIDMELVFKIASIMFFDAREDVTDFNSAYATKKIEHWKKHGFTSFFLLKPLQELIPIVNEDATGFVNAERSSEVNDQHLDNILKNLPKEKREHLQGKSYFSSVVLPQN